jgi:hypothetical protein
MLLTLTQFVGHKKYKELNLTTDCLRKAIQRKQLLGIKTGSHCWQVDPADVQKWLFGLNCKNPKAVSKINEIFFGKEFAKAITKQD